MYAQNIVIVANVSRFFGNHSELKHDTSVIPVNGSTIWPISLQFVNYFLKVRIN